MSDQDVMQKFLRYEELKIQAKKIDDEIKKLQKDIIVHMPDDGEPVHAKHGTFSIRSRSAWVYSDQVEKLQKAVDDRKAEEEAKGIAKTVKHSSLYYNSSKKKNDSD